MINPLVVVAVITSIITVGLFSPSRLPIGTLFSDNFESEQINNIKWEVSNTIGDQLAIETDAANGNSFLSLTWKPFEFYQNGFRAEIFQPTGELSEVPNFYGSDEDDNKQNRWGSENLETQGGEVWYRWKFRIDPSTNILDKCVNQPLSGNSSTGGEFLCRNGSSLTDQVFIAQWHDLVQNPLTFDATNGESPVIGLSYINRYPVDSSINGSYYKNNCSQGKHLALSVKIPLITGLCTPDCENNAPNCAATNQRSCTKILWEQKINEGEWYNVAFRVTWRQRGDTICVDQNGSDEQTSFFEFYFNNQLVSSNIRSSGSRDRCLNTSRFYYPLRQNFLRNTLKLGTYIVEMNAPEENQVTAELAPLINGSSSLRGARLPLTTAYVERNRIHRSDLANLVGLIRATSMSIPVGNVNTLRNWLTSKFNFDFNANPNLEVKHVIALAKNIEGVHNLLARKLKINYDDVKVGPTALSVGLTSSPIGEEKICRPWKNFNTPDTSALCFKNSAEVPDASGADSCTSTTR